jgi:hypothetical protein
MISLFPDNLSGHILIPAKPSVYLRPSVVELKRPPADHKANGAYLLSLVVVLFAAARVAPTGADTPRAESVCQSRAGVPPAPGVWTFWKSRLGSTGMALGNPEGIASLSPGLSDLILSG